MHAPPRPFRLFVTETFLEHANFPRGWELWTLDWSTELHPKDIAYMEEQTNRLRAMHTNRRFRVWEHRLTDPVLVIEPV